MSTIARAVDETKKEQITLTINGKKVNIKKGATVLEAALDARIYIPTLCHDNDLEPFGACRLCVVEVEGMRQLV
ncbi:MAG: 2Fe-2S iron-sulfur cluster-binding protein, partial [Dehalococcoidia bacterium]